MKTISNPAAFRVSVFLLLAVVMIPSISSGQEDQLLEREMEEFDRIAKENGYVGLYKNGGIARFLYRVKHGDQMSSGLNKFFWSDISANDNRLDAKFEAIQLFDGLIIYDLNDFKGNEVIRFTIIVPSVEGEAFLEGQTLRHRMHVYTGNITYTTVLGVERTIPLFKPVAFEEVD
ncbi:MAG: hypothetical protein C0613_08425 [Desulfobulbaceae bacterium]|nr:MAG: hypothetical protein C0613_08425 [Desulfobulbaceae bacterium]